MSEDSEIGKRQIEEIVLDQLLDTLPILTGRAVTNEWEGDAQRVDGSPDHIIGLDGQPFGVELTEIRGAEDAQGYVDEAYRLASKKSESYARPGVFRFPITLVMYSAEPPCSKSEDPLRRRLSSPTSRRSASLKSGPPISATPTTVPAIRADQPICFA